MDVTYDSYVHASTLHTLQQPLTKDPGEMSFLVVSQVMELYFGLACFELREAQRRLRDDDAWGAVGPLRRTVLDLEALNAAWRGLAWMTPVDFDRFRAALGGASGFHSVVYRRLEFLLGLKGEAAVRPFHREPEVYGELLDALRAPSVWDDVLALLASRGFDIPEGVLRADRTSDHEPHPSVVAAWAAIYRDDRPDYDLRALGEALTDIAERFGDWQHRHLVAVRRTMGTKPGTAGTAGAAFLARQMDQVVFPELWMARTEL